ncbi:MAG: cupin domain-containing protein [Acidobacteria bacterium]|nr:MAG: cupin domain-containing protein [Acidobacteriota bacterium]
MPREGQIVHLSAGTGRAFWGPGDMYTFLVTGEQTGGAYFVMEALVPPGGGPPPHIHRNEDETFYIVEGQCSIRLSDQTVNAAAGDFVNVPQGIVHCFRNEGTSTMRMVLTYSPSGIEKSFEETLEPALDRRSGPPPNIQALADRFVAAGPKYGIEFFAPGASFTDAA